MRTNIFRTFTFASMLLSAIAFYDWSMNDFDILSEQVNEPEANQFSSTPPIGEDVDHSNSIKEDDDQKQTISYFIDGVPGSEKLMDEMDGVEITNKDAISFRFYGGNEEYTISYDDIRKMAQSYYKCKNLVGILGKILEKFDGEERVVNSGVKKILDCRGMGICYEIAKTLGKEFFSELTKKGFRKEDIKEVLNIFLIVQTCAYQYGNTFFEELDKVMDGDLDYIKDIWWRLAAFGGNVVVEAYGKDFLGELYKIGFEQCEIEKFLKTKSPSLGNGTAYDFLKSVGAI